MARFSNKIKAFFTSTIEFVEKASFFRFETKERVRIVITSLLLTLYFIVSFSILQVGSDYFQQNVLRIIFSFIGLFIVILNLYIFLIDYKLKSKAPKKTKNIFIIILAISIVIMLGMYFAGDTIGTSSDIQDQYNQAISGDYNNWHPVMHTFLFYKVPIVIFGESIGGVLLFQYLFVAVMLAYLIYSFYRFGHKAHIIIIMVALMLINSGFRYIIKFPWKDIPFAFSLLFLTTNLMWIYLSQGTWLKKKGNIALFVISALLVLFLRHNGILALIPTVIVLIIAYKSVRKRIIIISASVLVVYFAVTIPIYSLLNIKGHAQSFAEAVGVPNNQLCYIVQNNGEMTEKEREFIGGIVPVGVIEYAYEVGNFNSIKWRKNKAGTAYYYSGEYVENNKTEYIKTWLSVINKNRELAFEGYYHATRELWVSRLEVTDKFSYSVGLVFFLATLFIVAAAFRDKRRLVVYIPMLFNMLGIMMLVTGGEIRFVFANLVCGIPLVLFALTPKDAIVLVQSANDKTIENA